MLRKIGAGMLMIGLAQPGYAGPSSDLLDGKTVMGQPIAQVDIIGEWYDGGPNCLKIAPSKDQHNLLVKAWYCNSGEPRTFTPVTTEYRSVASFLDDAGIISLLFVTRETLVATFKYPPPNDDHLNTHVVFRKVPPGTLR